MDGAIHRTAGPSLMRETQEKYPRGCTVGCRGDLCRPIAGEVCAACGRPGLARRNAQPALLSSAYRRCLELAREQGCTSLASSRDQHGSLWVSERFGGTVSLDTVRAFLLEHQQPELVRFILFDEGSYGAYARVLEQYLG